MHTISHNQEATSNKANSELSFSVPGPPLQDGGVDGQLPGVGKLRHQACFFGSNKMAKDHS